MSPLSPSSPAAPGQRHARSGITALTLWGGFASTVFIPLVQLLLDRYGWRDTLMVLGAINLVLCAGLYAGVINPGLDHPAEGHASSQDASRTTGSVVRWAMRQPVFWALAIAFTAYSATFSAFTFHLYPLLTERGLDSAAVVAAMAIIGPAQVAGRVAIWVLAPHASVRIIGSAIMLVFPVALLMLAELPPSFTLIAIVAAPLWLGQWHHDHRARAFGAGDADPPGLWLGERRALGAVLRQPRHRPAWNGGPLVRDGFL